MAGGSIRDRKLYDHVHLRIGILIFPIVADTVEQPLFLIHQHREARIGIIEILSRFGDLVREVAL